MDLNPEDCDDGEEGKTLPALFRFLFIRSSRGITHFARPFLFAWCYRFSLPFLPTEALIMEAVFESLAHLRNELAACKNDIMSVRDENQQLRSELGMMKQERTNKYKLEDTLSSSSSVNFGQDKLSTTKIPELDQVPKSSASVSCYVIEPCKDILRNVTCLGNLELKTPPLVDKERKVITISSDNTFSGKSFDIVPKKLKFNHGTQLASRNRRSPFLKFVNISKKENVAIRNKNLSANAAIIHKLSSHEENLIKEFIALKDDRNALLDHTMGVLLRKDVLNLLEGEKIIDRVVDEFSMLLKTKASKKPGDYLRCIFFNPWFHELLTRSSWGQVISNFREEGIEKLCHSQLMFLPICCNDHWILIVVNVDQKEFQIYDSLPQQDSFMKSQQLQLNKVINLLKAAFLMIDWVDLISCPTIHIKERPMQWDGVSCGVFLMKYMECLASGKDFNFNQDEIGHQRKYIAGQILEGARRGREMWS